MVVGFISIHLILKFTVRIAKFDCAKKAVQALRSHTYVNAKALKDAGSGEMPTDAEILMNTGMLADTKMLTDAEVLTNAVAVADSEVLTDGVLLTDVKVSIDGVLLKVANVPTDGEALSLVTDRVALKDAESNTDGMGVVLRDADLHLDANAKRLTYAKGPGI